MYHVGSICEKAQQNFTKSQDIRVTSFTKIYTSCSYTQSFSKKFSPEPCLPEIPPLGGTKYSK